MPPRTTDLCQMMGVGFDAHRSAGYRPKHDNANPVQRLLVDRFQGETVRLVSSAGPSTALDIGYREGYAPEVVDRAGSPLRSPVLTWPRRQRQPLGIA